MQMKLLAWEKSVGGVVVRKEGAQFLYLLLHYPSGHWDFPKGHVEKSETEIQTLQREIAEETGIMDTQVVPKFRTAVRYWYKAKGKERERRKQEGRGTFIVKKVVYYLVTTSTIEIKISFEHVDYGWFTWEEALKRITHENSRRVLMQSKEFAK